MQHHAPNASLRDINLIKMICLSSVINQARRNDKWEIIFLWRKSQNPESCWASWTSHLVNWPSPLSVTLLILAAQAHVSFGRMVAVIISWEVVFFFSRNKNLNLPLFHFSLHAPAETYSAMNHFQICSFCVTAQKKKYLPRSVRQEYLEIIQIKQNYKLFFFPHDGKKNTWLSSLFGGFEVCFLKYFYST